MHVKIGDTVKVISGHDKGKIGEITNVNKHNSTVLVKDVNVKTKHVKGKQEGESGQIIQPNSYIRMEIEVHQGPNAYDCLPLHVNLSFETLASLHVGLEMRVQGWGHEGEGGFLHMYCGRHPGRTLIPSTSENLSSMATPDSSDLPFPARERSSSEILLSHSPHHRGGDIHELIICTMDYPILKEVVLLSDQFEIDILVTRIIEGSQDLSSILDAVESTGLIIACHLIKRLQILVQNVCCWVISPRGTICWPEFTLVEAPIHSSNVMLYSKMQNVASRVGHKVLEDGRKPRAALFAVHIGVGYIGTLPLATEKSSLPLQKSMYELINLKHFIQLTPGYLEQIPWCMLKQVEPSIAFVDIHYYRESWSGHVGLV
eukprot:Gb_13209 [translate_table: standard]